MDKEIDDWLKDADGVVIECEEDEITPYTLVSITPFYEKSGERTGRRARNHHNFDRIWARPRWNAVA